MSLRNEPLTLDAIWKKTTTSLIKRHFSQNTFFQLCIFFFRVFSIRLRVFKSLFKGSEDSLFLVFQGILDGVLQEHATGNRIDCLFVHLLQIFDERADWDLVSRLQ